MPAGINFWSPVNNGPKTLFTFWKNPIPVIFESTNRFLEHIKESASLSERNPSVLLRIPFGFGALYPEKMKK
jgi:hypothetical protein